MTDLRKGIIEIEGVEISANTTSLDIIENLKKSYANHATSKDGNCEIFVFKNIIVIDNSYDIDVTFINQKITNIQLFSLYDEKLSYEELFKADCEWLKKILGEPTVTGSNGVVYEYGSIQIGANYFESDGRSDSEEFIQINY